MEMFLIGAGIVVVVMVLMYNYLVGKKNQVDNIFGSVDAVLKQRYDLIPNLVATAKEYMTHERETLEKITELRSQALKQGLDTDTKMNLDAKVSQALGGLMVAVENYPNLKANENFLHLQHTLNELEEHIAAARRAYNQSVTDFNNAIEMFPTNLMAGFMHLERKHVFATPVQERQNVDVNHLFKK